MFRGHFHLSGYMVLDHFGKIGISMGFVFCNQVIPDAGPDKYFFNPFDGFQLPEQFDLP